MALLDKISKTDWWVIIGFWILAIPIIVTDYISNMNLSKAFQLTLVDIILITSVSIGTVYFLAPQYLSREKYFKFFVGLFVLLIVESFLYFIGVSMIWAWQQPRSWIEFIGDELVSNGQSLGILGGILLAKKYFESQQNLLKLEAETKANELRALQSQVNPHFLFNNLNSLDELIDSDPKEAKRYVNKLAQLYRYLISSKDNDVVVLKEEIAFAENYIYLLKQRYGDSYIFDIENQRVDFENVLIPPASLQLILENVVKHNIGSIENPLTTKIIYTDSHVRISNNKRLKNKQPDNGTGLNNLKTRYSLLSNKTVQVIDTDKEFTISLPLIPLLQ